jgi:hypothetical protein
MKDPASEATIQIETSRVNDDECTNKSVSSKASHQSMGKALDETPRKG